MLLVGTGGGVESFERMGFKGLSAKFFQPNTTTWIWLLNCDDIVELTHLCSISQTAHLPLLETTQRYTGYFLLVSNELWN